MESPSLELFRKHADFGTWFSGYGGFGVTVGLDDLRGLFQRMIL